MLPGLAVLARKLARQDILLVLDGAPNHRCGDLAVPANVTLLYLSPYSPELNPKENLWHEIREKIFKNYALKSTDAVPLAFRQYPGLAVGCDRRAGASAGNGHAKQMLGPLDGN